MVSPERYNLAADPSDTASTRLYKAAVRALLSRTTRYQGDAHRLRGVSQHRSDVGYTLTDYHASNVMGFDTSKGGANSAEQRRLLQNGTTVVSLSFEGAPTRDGYLLYRPGDLNHDLAIGALLIDAAPFEHDPSVPLAVQRTGLGFNPYEAVDDPLSRDHPYCTYVDLEQYSPVVQ